MVDNFTPQDPMQPPMDATVAVADAKPGLLASPKGRLMVIAGAIVAFIVVAGIVAFLVFTFLLGDEPSGEVTRPGGGSITSTGTAGIDSTQSVGIEPRDVSFSEIFTFRDIFDPLIEIEEEDPDDTDGDGVPDSVEPSATPETQPNTLFLQDIIVQDGVTTAVLVWNGAELPLTEGAVIPGTPWQVLSIRGGTVTMLFGDDQVTLTVGQGIAK